MRRDQFDHVIRAAGAVIGSNDVIVIGSQALHASVSDELPEVAERSMEVDVAVPDDSTGERADLIDGAIGEASMFHETFGIYGQGVSIEVAHLPEGWRDRLVPYSSQNTGGVTAWCLDIHDLWVAKALAGRPKDLEFCRELRRRETVERAVLRERLAETDSIPDPVKEAAERLLD